MDTTPEGNMAPQRSWWSRNWKWATPVGCLGLMASCGCFAVLAVALGLFTATKNPAYEQAVEIAQADSEVQATLGTPIKAGMSQQTSVQYVNGQSTAQFNIPLDGAKTDGLLRVEATKRDKEWVYQVLQVEVPGQPPIDLRDKVGGGTQRELAPPTPDAPPPAVNEEDGPPEDDKGDGDTKDDGDGKSDIEL